MAKDKKVLGKSELTDLIVAKTGLTKKDALNAIGVVLDGISDGLKAGNDISIIGFGKFKVTHVPERQGRNPSKGEAITIAARNKVTFSAGATLKQTVNS